MRIISNNIDFDLPVNFAAEFTRNNVMLTDAGEQTAPITLPPTPKNLKLVQNSDRIDNYYKPLTDLTVTVIDGLMNRQCNMGIHTANEVDGISCTLYFSTGEFYSLIDKIKLPSLPWPITKHPNYSNVNLATKVSYIVNLLKSEYENPTENAHFKIAPVVTSQEYTWRMRKHMPNGTYQNVDVTKNLILNDFEKFQYQLDFSGTGDEYLNHFEGEYNQQMIVDSAVVNISTGYGMTPFLKLRYIVEFIFAQYGYTFDSSSLESDINDLWTNIVLLNNVADAVYGGVLNYAQLLPNVLISDFLAFIEKTFGSKFIVNGITKSVELKKYTTVLNTVPDCDLSNYLTGKPKLGDTDFTIVTIIDNSSTITETDDSTLKTETISFDLVKEVEYVDTFNAALSGNSCDLLLHYAKIDSIIHKNSSLIVNGSKSTETANTSTSMYLAEITGNFTPADFKTDPNAPGISLVYKRSYSLFYFISGEDIYGMAQTDLRIIEDWYRSYIDFKRNSNIPINSVLNIPTSILESMLIQYPKLVNGQPVMIESIKETLGKNGTREVVLRTLRQFTDR